MTPQPEPVLTPQQQARKEECLQRAAEQLVRISARARVKKPA